MSDSISIKVLLVGTIIFALSWLTMGYCIEITSGEFTDLISDGGISYDTVSNMNTVLNLWVLSPVVYLLGLIMWTIERARGTNLTPGLFYMYNSVLLVGIFISIFMVMSFGMYIDYLYAAFFTDDLMEMIQANISPVDTFMIGVRVVYLLCLYPAIFGSALFLLHPYSLQSDSLVYGSDDEPTGEYVTNFQQIQ